MDEEALCFLAWFDHLPDEGSKTTTHEWTNDEYPNLRECSTTFEECRTEGTSWIHGSASVVDSYEVDENQAETDGKTSEVVGSTVCLCCCTEHNKHEEHGEHDLNNETQSDVAIRTSICTRVSAKSQTWFHANDGSQAASSQYATDELTYPIANSVLCRHTTTEKNTKRDGWIDVATTDTTDAISHSHNGKTESNGCAYY